MEKKTPWYDKIEIFIILVLFSAMTIITFTSVVSRYCFNFTFSWAEQLVRFMFVWITFAGISLAGLRGAHMRVTAITLLIGEKKGRYVFWLGDLVTIAFALFIAWKMALVTRNNFVNKQVFTAMTWMPVWCMYISGVLGMIGLAIRTATRMIKEIKAFKAEGGAK